MIICFSDLENSHHLFLTFKYWIIISVKMLRILNDNNNVLLLYLTVAYSIKHLFDLSQWLHVFLRRIERMRWFQSIHLKCRVQVVHEKHIFLRIRWETVKKEDVHCVTWISFFFFLERKLKKKITFLNTLMHGLKRICAHSLKTTVRKTHLPFQMKAQLGPRRCTTCTWQSLHSAILGSTISWSPNFQTTVNRKEEKCSQLKFKFVQNTFSGQTDLERLAINAGHLPFIWLIILISGIHKPGAPARVRWAWWSLACPTLTTLLPHTAHFPPGMWPVPSSPWLQCLSLATQTDLHGSDCKDVCNR